MIFWKKESETIETDYMIVFRDGALDTIKKVKGWRTDAELARHLDFTRQYICALKKRKLPCTHDVIVRIAMILGDTNGNWWNHFEIVKLGKYRPNHQKYNQLKHDGRQPYSKNSVMVEMRSKDSIVEKREI